MKKRRTATHAKVCGILVAAAYLLTACAGRVENVHSSSDTSGASTAPSGELQSIALLDPDDYLTGEQEAALLEFSGSWSKEHGVSVLFAVTGACSAGCESRESHVAHIRQEMGAKENEVLVLLEATSKTAVVDHGLATGLSESGITLDIRANEEFGAALLSYASKVDAFLNDTYARTGTEIAAAFDGYMQQLGFVVIDVTEMNHATYPDSVVKQAGDGHVELFCLSGTENDAGLLWNVYYQLCINSGAEGTFIQKWDPADSHAPCSVEAIVQGQYVRAELVSGTCVAATTSELTLIGAIDSIISGLGVPENNASPS